MSLDRRSPGGVGSRERSSFSRSEEGEAALQPLVVSLQQPPRVYNKVRSCGQIDWRAIEIIEASFDVKYLRKTVWCMSVRMCQKKIRYAPVRWALRYASTVGEICGV